MNDIWACKYISILGPEVVYRNLDLKSKGQNLKLQPCRLDITMPFLLSSYHVFSFHHYTVRHIFSHCLIQGYWFHIYFLAFFVSWISMKRHLFSGTKNAAFQFAKFLWVDKRIVQVVSYFPMLFWYRNADDDDRKSSAGAQTGKARERE